MTKDKTHRTAAFALALIISCTAGVAIADEFNAQRAVLAQVRLVQTKNVDHVEVQRLNFAPGATSGLHQHPGPVLGYVVSGAVVLQVNDEKTTTYSAGQSLYEPAGKRITRLDNASKTAPAVVVATYLLAREDKEVTLKLD